MRIQYVKLHNIRSYKDAKVEFKEGSTLLLGDIGSGKSTILLATEFAIFGFLKSEITGNSLLRHGEQNGSVDLCFLIDKNEIIVRRELKRTQDAIIPIKCFLTINGEIEQLTSTELRERLFSILKYPRSIVTKNPTLIYRYTVYTPQEQLKEIIYDDPEGRIDLLRKIFGIDKYKKIINNVDMYTAYLRGKVREYKGQIYDLEELKKQTTDCVEKLTLLETKQEKDKKELEMISAEYEKAKEEHDKILEELKQKEKIKKELELLSVKSDENKKQMAKTEFLIESSKKDIFECESKIDKDVKTDEDIDVKKINRELLEIQEEHNSKKISSEKNLQRKALYEKHLEETKKNIETKTNVLNSKFLNITEEIIQETKDKIEQNKKEVTNKRKKTELLLEETKKNFFTINALINKSREIEQKIATLENCPTCLQKVTDGHKEKINNEEKKRQKDFEERMKKYKEDITKQKEILEETEKKLTDIHEEEKMLSKKIEMLSQKKEWNLEIVKLSEKQKNIEETLTNIDSELKQIESFETLLERIKDKRNEIELALEHNKKINFQRNILEKIKIHKELLENYEKTNESLALEELELTKKRKELELELELDTSLDDKEKESFVKLKYYDDEIKKKNIENASLDKDILNTKENLGALTKKLEYKLNIEKNIEKMNKIIEFLSPIFSDLISAIETKMMQKIYTTFNYLFKKWFSMLIEDENIAVRLDENFNPRISQNGYDTNVYNLSGGEKTSLALSYRLSLTKTINEILSNQTTNSLLILDEPTDGFSEQQLDRMRDVLSELEIKQIIIVSHENKIESFVDNIINVSKKEHVSAII